MLALVGIHLDKQVNPVGLLRETQTASTISIGREKDNSLHS
jgi:hypothetical protein